MNRTNDILKTYVRDMVALERHILEAVDRQAADAAVKSHPQAILAIEKAQRSARAHLALLEGHLQTLGDSTGGSIKETVATLAGMAAGVIDKFRTHPVSKDLRDDYTVLSLAAISYTALHTAALALGNNATADLASRHLHDLTPIIVEISEIIPSIVVAELAAEEPRVDRTVAERALANTHHAWTRHGLANAA